MNSYPINRLISSTLILTTLLTVSCRKDRVQGVVIGETLLAHQTLEENWKMSDAIQRVLDRNEAGITELLSTDCGGGAGCYELGYVITQLIDKVGDEAFAAMIAGLPPEKLEKMAGYINVGLEYFDGTRRNRIDNQSVEATYPLVNQVLSKNEINF